MNLQPQLQQSNEIGYVNHGNTINNASNHEANEPTLPLSPNVNNYFSNSFNLSPEKVTYIIQKWNVHFDGSSSGLHCEEFIYRIRCLTNDNFNGNFEPVCKNLHLLLTNKASRWFWYFHKQMERITWDSFCTALRKQYKDYRTRFDILEELRNRKQKPDLMGSCPSF